MTRKTRRKANPDRKVFFYDNMHAVVGPIYNVSVSLLSAFNNSGWPRCHDGPLLGGFMQHAHWLVKTLLPPDWFDPCFFWCLTFFFLSICLSVCACMHFQTVVVVVVVVTVLVVCFVLVEFCLSTFLFMGALLSRSFVRWFFPSTNQ